MHVVLTALESLGPMAYIVLGLALVLSARIFRRPAAGRRDGASLVVRSEKVVSIDCKLRRMQVSNF